MRTLHILLVVGLFAMHIEAASIVLIQGTTSTPNTAERNYARKLTDTLQDWLVELGIACTTLPDEAITSQSLKDVDVAILGYNPHLPDSELGALRHYVDEGGKLIVFYSADSRLARLMGLRMGPYRPAPAGAPWTGMRVTAHTPPPHMPNALTQVSRNIRPAHPLDSRSRILAYWVTGRDTLTREPALLESPHGFWMTHVLMRDSDTAAKKRFLLAMVGALAPAVWRPAAEHGLAEVGVMGRYRSFSAAVEAIEIRAGQASAAKRIREILDQAETDRSAAEAHLKAGRYIESLNATSHAHTALVEAYARTWSPRANEIRGVWEHSGTGLFSGDWLRTCRLLKQHGITDLFTNLMWPGRARYASEHVPRDAVFARYGDQAEQAMAAAQETGIRIHAWKVCWRLDGAPPAFLATLRSEGRLQQDDQGRTINWLCPSHEANLRYEKDAVREFLRRYPVAGIHLDYIRYRDSHACYCPTCRAAFEAALSVHTKAWPQDVTRGVHKQAYRTWRASQITRLVRDVGVLAHRMRPDIQVSAAVYGRYPLCVQSVGQDWGKWLQEGYIDFVCPMNYTEALPDFVRYTHAQFQLPEAAGHILPGIGATAAECQLDPASVLEQIEASRIAGATGFVLYELNTRLAREILPLVSLGATRPD